MNSEQFNRILAKFAGEEPISSKTAEEIERAAAIAAEWEAHSIRCEWINDNVPATERHVAFAELDQEFEARGIIDPTFRG